MRRTPNQPATHFAQPPKGVAERLAIWGGADAFGEICRAVVREQGVLVEESALMEEALARIAASLDRDRETSDFQKEDLSKIALQAITEILRRDHQRLIAGEAGARAGSTRDEFVVQALGFHPDEAHRVAVRFNSLSLRTRRAFFDVLIDHIPPSEVVQREEAWPSARALVKDLYAAILHLRGSEPNSL